MNGKIGPLLEAAIHKVSAAASEELEFHIAAGFGGEREDRSLPVIVQLPNRPPEVGESWERYRDRTRERLEPIAHRLSERLEQEVTPLIAANGFQTTVLPEQAGDLAGEGDLESVELDPVVQVTQMDDVAGDLGLDDFRVRHPDLDGSGVRVAVLDSGIDAAHPYLQVHDQVSTCKEPVDFPGRHATHVAGSIASRDSLYGGIAPDVELLNIKVLRADGSGQHTFIERGVDEALDLGAQVLSLSLGFNHLPTWWQGGHGWSCPDGQCALCRAIDNAVSLDGVVAVVAAGNDHDRAQALRAAGWGSSLDTEIECPGQARQAITVGALTKKTFLSATFSSCGPTADGRDKPDISAPGVNITSTGPVPRDPAGQPIPDPPRSQHFFRSSGTSTATPIVSGVVALLIQKARMAGNTWTPASIVQELYEQGTQLIGGGTLVVGRGRVSLNLV